MGRRSGSDLEGEMRPWISVVTILFLTGCSAVPSVSTHSLAREAAIQQNGGAFGGSYSGSFASSPCPPDGNGSYRFTGKGSAAFIHESREKVSFSGSGCTSQKWSGTATLTNLSHPRSSITM